MQVYLLLLLNKTRMAIPRSKGSNHIILSLHRKV